MATMINVELSNEQTESIIQEILKDDFESMSFDIARLSRRKDLADFELQDLEDFKRIRKAMKRLLRYYMPSKEANEFIDGVKLDVNLSSFEKKENL